MQIFERQADLKSHLKSLASGKMTIGFVPTMGALHQGHLSLMAQSLKDNDVTVMSIFVNPTQFNNPDDLKKYPRTLEADIEKIRTVSDNVIVYAPSVDDIYGGKTTSEHFNFDGIDKQMEGRHRPGHFDGVGTVVKRLFDIVKPHNAYFGEKDFQQLQIIRKLVSKYNIPVNIIGMPIFREANGLAMSSRNERLLPEQKHKASVIFSTLKYAKEMFGTKSAKEVTAFVEKSFKNIDGFRLEYFEIADESTLLPVIRKSKNKKYRGFIAVFVKDIRLIDTISFN
ncbi:pantoate--beta-alanine ligase [Flavobacterium pallidum]|uniref:Pantothenate synthetase n=1 Tax=Flavobacterium pallidum TaxID=2172098 RepID=A0A2S1SFY8_9FLAO|nr:pantoate--beta-alanine ligase [Flavobacterium pallidum]AWI25326.1 pantoate--beta-alanine ligase [Flavobacterium pallidum]